MRDVHAGPPTEHHLSLHRVGLAGIRKPLSVHRPDRVVTLGAEFSLTVDLPSDRKGSDLSRNVVALAELIDTALAEPVPGLEAACARVAQALLVRHPSATRAHVEARAAYFRPGGVRPEHQSWEEYGLLAGADAERGIGRDPRAIRTIGAEAVGMTACPCAMEGCRELLLNEFPMLRAPELRDLPIVTHNQRNRTTLVLRLAGTAEVEADELIDAIEAAQSSPTFDILKRGDEAALVLAAHRNPKFVEDVVRGLLAGLPGRFAALPDDTEVEVRSRSEESIHKYDVVAEHATTLGELRRPGPTPA